MIMNRIFRTIALVCGTLAVLFLAQQAAVVVGQSDCKDIKRVDKCAQNLYIYGDREFKFPSSPAEARASCRRTKEAEKCVRDYATSCTKAFLRQYINIMLAGPIQVVKDRCTRVGIREMLKHKECLDATKPDIDKCNIQTIEDSLRITKANKDDWIPLTCCFLSKTSKCSLAAIDKKCTKNPEAASYATDSIKSMQGEVYDLLCGNGYVWGNDKCNRITRNLGLADPNIERPKSILPIALDMIEKYLKRD